MFAESEELGEADPLDLELYELRRKLIAKVNVTLGPAALLVVLSILRRLEMFHAHTGGPAVLLAMLCYSQSSRRQSPPVALNAPVYLATCLLN